MYKNWLYLPRRTFIWCRYIIYLVPNIYWVPNLMFLYLPKFYYRVEMNLVPNFIKFWKIGAEVRLPDLTVAFQPFSVLTKKSTIELNRDETFDGRISTFWPKIKNIGQNMITLPKEARNKLHTVCSIRYPLVHLNLYFIWKE